MNKYDYSRTYIPPKFKNLKELKTYLNGFNNKDNMDKNF